MAKATGERDCKMTKKYMNKVFMETFDDNFYKPGGAMRNVPTEFWQLNEDARPKIRQHARKAGYFTAEEEAQLKLIGKRKGRADTGLGAEALSKEQQLINKKVR